MYRNIRVSTHIADEIKKKSKELKTTQNDIIERSFNCAKLTNFTPDLPTETILKGQKKETNRLIGFVKTQDKKMMQLEENIYQFFNRRLKEDRRTILDNYSYIIEENIHQVTKLYFDSQGVSKDVEAYAQLMKELLRLLEPILVSEMNKLK